MTDSTGATTPEPSNAELLAFMKTAFAQINANFESHAAAISAASAKVDDAAASLGAKVDSVQAEMREGFAGVKGELALNERYILDARRAILGHANDPNAHRDAA